MATPSFDRLFDAQDTIIDAVAFIGEPVTSAMTRAAGSIEPRLSRLTSHVPSVRDLLDNHHDLTIRLVNTSHDLAISVVDAAGPVMAKVTRSAV